jgi:prephenate dehydrogenase
VIDAIATDWASALDGADLVLLGMPVGQMPAVMRAMASHLQPHTIVTDGGSTKSDVVAAARAAFGDKIGNSFPAIRSPARKRAVWPQRRRISMSTSAWC